MLRWPLRITAAPRGTICPCSNPSKGAILASKLPECGECRIKSDWGGGMKLYDFTRAPNPRRVRIFLAEKGITVAMEQVDLFTGANRTPEALRRNPYGGLPVPELDDGACIAESVAICRYFEDLHPQPALMGVFLIGKPGWVRSSAWICDFSSTDNTTACAGGST